MPAFSGCCVPKPRERRLIVGNGVVLARRPSPAETIDHSMKSPLLTFLQWSMALRTRM